MYCCVMTASTAVGQAAGEEAERHELAWLCIVRHGFWGQQKGLAELGGWDLHMVRFVLFFSPNLCRLCNTASILRVSPHGELHVQNAGTHGSHVILS